MALPPGHFTLKTAQDLYQKLERDFTALRAAPTSADACFNFFVTAEHLPEWKYAGDGKRANELRKEHALLRVCSQLANGAKHFETRDQRHNAVVSTTEVTIQKLSLSGKAEASDNDAGAVNEFLIMLNSNEAEELGQGEITATELAGRILEFWKRQLSSSKGNNLLFLAP